MTAQMVDPMQDGDPVLISRVRAGDPDAYGLLFERHRAAAVAFAGRLAGPNYADDLVAEAFAKVLDVLRRGLGPTVSFRSYLLTSIRSVWSNTVRSEQRYHLVDDYLVEPVGERAASDPDQRFDNRMVAAAFQSLPERWQAALWYTAVEGMSHAEIAVILGVKPNAVAAVSFRAREGLRQAFLAEHIRAVDDETCRMWADSLSPYVRGTLDRRKVAKLEAHLDGCIACTAALAHLDDVNNRLGALLLPIVLGAGFVGGDDLWRGLVAQSAGAQSASTRSATLGAGKAGLTAAVATAVAATVAGLGIGLPLLLARTNPSVTAGPEASSYGGVAVDPAPRRPGPAHPVTLGPVREEPVREAAPPRRAVRATASRPTRQPTPRGSVLAAGGATLSGVTPTAPATPPSSSTPPTAEPPDESSDLSLGQASASSGAGGLVHVEVPVANLRPGVVVPVTITNVLGLPSRLTGSWRCPGTVDGTACAMIGVEK